MKKFQQLLYNAAENGDDKAAELYLNSMNLNDDDLALWVANNDKKLRDVLSLKEYSSVLQDDEDGEIKDWFKEYNDLRQKGLFMFKGDKRVGPTGHPLKTLDEFMSAFGVTQKEDGYNDDARAAFTNPDNPQYWGNMSDEDKTLAALSLGYDSADDMKLDLDRAANQFQRVLAVEGWDANNEIKPLEFLWSTLKGLGAPRVKEAQLAGREWTWQDAVGDMAELGLNFVPGVGLVKAGKLIAKVPKIGTKLVKNNGLNFAGRGAALLLDQAFVPLGTELLDAGILYNPNVAGKNTSALNPRSEFDLMSVAAQAGGIAGAKGAVKAGAGVAKSMMEQGLGNEVGGGLFEKGVKKFEAIGEKTDDLIARRQLMLDRKADLAKKRVNVTLDGDLDISSELADADDLINAENFRLLTKEAERLAKSNKIRSDYRTKVYGDLSLKEMDDLIEEKHRLGVLVEDPTENLKYHQRINAGDDIQRKYGDEKLLENKYRNKNESNPYRNLIQLEDGRIVPLQYINPNGSLSYPGADYSFTVNGNKNPLTYMYDDDYNKIRDALYYEKGGVKIAYPSGIDDENPISRNPAVLKQIKNDELLKRKLDPTKTVIREGARDVAANAAFNAISRQGLVNNIDELKQKREDAFWNRTMNKLRPLTANANLTPEVRKKNIDAVLNVMQYGLDGVPKELYDKAPQTYQLIANKLGINNWIHPSVEE